jgi:ATP/ADP translocase
MTARATSDSFLLKYFEPADISMMIMGAASLSIVLALFSTFLCSKYQALGAMQIATFGLSITLFILIAVISMFKSKFVFGISYMVCEVIVILPMVLFWGMTVGILNPSESKKWFGLIGAAGTCGCILAGYTVSLASKSSMVNELSLGIVSALLLVVNLILFFKGKSLKISSASKPAMQSTNLFRKFAVLFSGKQSVLMTLLVVCSATALSVIDINFKFEVRRDQQDLYDFFGLFYTYTSIAQLVLQLLIVRAILTGGGVIAAITILPSMLILTSIGALMVGSQNAIYVSKFITQVVFFTIEYVGLQMLFLAVSKQLRGQMNSAVDGLTRPATIALISLLISYSLPFWQGGTESDIVYRLNLVVVGLCTCWLFVSYLNYKEYLSSLLNMLGSRKLDYEEVREVNFDPKFLSELKKDFANADDENAFLLSELVMQLKIDGWTDEFKSCLTRQHSGLRKNAYLYLIGTKDYDFIYSLIAEVYNEEEDIQIQFIENLLAADSINKYSLIEKFLDSSSKQVSCIAATSLMNSDDLEFKEKGDQVFKSFLHSENEESLFSALKSLPYLQKVDTSLILSGFINSNDLRFQFEALRCINSYNVEKLFPHIFKLASSNHNQALILQKVKQCGAEIEKVIDEKIEQALKDEAKDDLALLLKFKLESSLVKKSALFESRLEYLGDHPQAIPLEIDYVDNILGNRVNRLLKKWARKRMDEVLDKALDCIETSSCFPRSTKYQTFSFLLDSRKDNYIKLLLKLLAIIDPVVDFNKLFDVAKEKGADAKSEVEEVLKGSLNPRLSEKILSVILGSHPGEARDFDFFFTKFSSDRSKWVYCSLLMAMYSEDFFRHKQYVNSGLKHVDFLVRECALHTYLQYEKDQKKINDVCDEMRNDEEIKVAVMATQQLRIA